MSVRLPTVDNQTRTAPDIGADEFVQLLQLIFTDGFESGNLAAWSSSVP